MGWAQLGEGVPQVSERPGSWGTTQAPLGTETFLLPGILSAYLRPQPPPAPSSAALGPLRLQPLAGSRCQHKPYHPPALGTRQPPVYEASQPPVTAMPTGWGRDDRWRRCHFNQSLQPLGKERK